VARKEGRQKLVPGNRSWTKTKGVRMLENHRLHILTSRNEDGSLGIKEVKGEGPIGKKKGSGCYWLEKWGGKRQYVL